MYVRVYVSTLSLSINTQKRTWPISGHLTSRLVSNAYFHLWTLLFPEGLKNMFKPTSRVHSYSVRGSSNNVFVSRPCIRKQLRGRLAIRAAATGGYSVSNTVADPVLQIRGEEGGGLFRLFGPQFGLKIRGGGASPPGPLTWIRHGQLFKVRSDIVLNWGGGIYDSTYSVMVRVEPPLTRRPPLFKGHSFCQTVHSATLRSILRDDTHTKRKQLRIRLVFIAVFVKSSWL